MLASQESGGNDGEGDVNDVLRAYFGSVEAKDEDIYRLYADNQRMRDLVEASCAARQELDERLHTTQLLVASLKTELNEKRCLVEAQEAEALAFRDGIADLRVILGKPSELDFTIDDCVAEVEHMVANDRQRQRHVQGLLTGVEGLSLWALNMLDEAEKRERASLEEAALVTTRVLATSAAMSVEDAARVADQEATVEAQQTQLRELQAQHWRALTEAQERAETMLREWRDKFRAQQSDLERQNQRYACAIAEKQKADTCLEAAVTTLDLLGQRVMAAEGLLRNWLSASRSLACAEAATHADAYAKLERAHQELSHALGAARLQLDRDSKARQQLSGAQEAHETTQAALELLKVKYTAHLEKASLQRQRQALLDKKHQEALAASEENAERHTRQAALLEAQLASRDEDLQRAHKALQHAAKNAVTSEEALEAARARVQVLEVALRDADSAVHAQVKHTHKAQLCALTSAETAARELVELSEGDARTLLRREHTASMQAQAYVAQCGQAVNMYKTELREWAAVAEDAKARAYALEQHLDRERDARALLEAQQRQEGVLHKQLLWRVSEQARLIGVAEEVAREREALVQDLRCRVQTLEGASETSAATIRALTAGHQSVLGTSQRSMIDGVDALSPVRSWRSAECALLERIDRAMDASSALVTTPARVAPSPLDLVSD